MAPASNAELASALEQGLLGPAEVLDALGLTSNELLRDVQASEAPPPSAAGTSGGGSGRGSQSADMTFDMAIPMGSAPSGRSSSGPSSSGPSPVAPEEAAPEEEQGGSERAPIEVGTVEVPEEAPPTNQDNTVAVGFAGMMHQGDVDLTDSFGCASPRHMQFENVKAIPDDDQYIVTGHFLWDVHWDVANSAPQGQELVESPDSPAITAANYVEVADDLAPTSWWGGYPTRESYWSRSMVVQHELFHAREWMEFGKANFQGAVANLEWWDLSSFSESGLEETMMDMGFSIFKKTGDEDMKFPGVEMRAYTDGAAGYQKLSDGIRAKGDAGGYDAGEEDSRGLGAGLQEALGGVLGASMANLPSSGLAELSGWLSDDQD